MSVSDFVGRTVHERLDRRSIVAWYDEEGVFDRVATSLAGADVTVVSVGGSRLQARREADTWVRSFERHRTNRKLLLYIPWRRTIEDQRTRDPFETYALMGEAFGHIEAEQLESLACQALPARATEIHRLFRQGRPTLETLDDLEAGRSYPLLRQALGVDGATEVSARVLCVPDTLGQIDAVRGSVPQLWELTQSVFGYTPAASARSLQRAVRNFGTYVLFSEFAADSGRPLPDALETLSRATRPTHEEAIRTLCDFMRSSESTREGYVAVASRVEDELGLAESIATIAVIGDRDTFPAEDRAALIAAIGHIEQQSSDAAGRLIERRRRSVWRADPERALHWRVAERSLEFLRALQETQQSHIAGDRTSDYVKWYSVYGWTLDRRQRVLEQAVAEAAAPDEFGALMSRCRAEYRRVAGDVQDGFLEAVVRDGWPPQGMTTQTEVFDRAVAPRLAAGARTAYFLVDAMRYEMGRDISESLEDLGEVSVEPVATVIPTTTPAGMAALMPGAHGTWRLLDHADSLAPALGDRRLTSASDRVVWLRERLGDRYEDVRFEDLIRLSVKQLEPRLTSPELLVVRTQEIDAIGEGGAGGLVARRIMSDVLSWIRQAINKLAMLGFREFVLSADHGFVLLPEVAAGDVVKEPPGTWKLRKRRSRLGQAAGSSPGVVTIAAHTLGTTGDLDDVAVPTGFRVFAADAEYFHEGISLQECVVPLVTLKLSGPVGVGRPGNERVDVSYKSDRFTSRIIGLKLRLDALLTEEVLVRVEAYDGTSAAAQRVGDAADCDARDETTGLVRLVRGHDTPVPLRLVDDFRGREIQIRVINAEGSEVVFGTLRLANAMME